jgi:hypothetical protein
MFLLHEEHVGIFGSTVKESITIVSNDTINIADADEMI